MALHPPEMHEPDFSDINIARLAARQLQLTANKHAKSSLPIQADSRKPLAVNTKRESRRTSKILHRRRPPSVSRPSSRHRQRSGSLSSITDVTSERSKSRTRSQRRVSDHSSSSSDDSNSDSSGHSHESSSSSSSSSEASKRRSHRSRKSRHSRQSCRSCRTRREGRSKRSSHRGSVRSSRNASLPSSRAASPIQPDDSKVKRDQAVNQIILDTLSDADLAEMGLDRHAISRPPAQPKQQVIISDGHGGMLVTDARNLRPYTPSQSGRQQHVRTNSDPRMRQLLSPTANLVAFPTSSSAREHPPLMPQRPRMLLQRYSTSATLAPLTQISARGARSVPASPVYTPLAYFPENATKPSTSHIPYY